jgi:quinate/shikimate dehydrogenase (NAD+)
MSGRMLVGLIGINIGQSLAPALHEDAFAAAGMTGHYHLMDAETPRRRTLPDLLGAAGTAGFGGVNITFPFKEAVIPLLDHVSSEAKEIGAVNTVVFDAAGRTSGHNTDRSGFRAAFIEAFGNDAARGKPVLLLGAGGAGRAVAFALRDLGAAPIRLYDRDGQKARALAADLGAGACEVLDAPEPAAASAAGIVNATPIGMTGHEGLPMTPDVVRPGQFVADGIYTPLETEFVKAAKARGARTMGGAGMCVHQAVDAFRHFTGKTPDIERLKRTFADAAIRRAKGGPT